MMFLLQVDFHKGADDTNIQHEMNNDIEGSPRNMHTLSKIFRVMQQFLFNIFLVNKYLMEDLAFT